MAMDLGRSAAAAEINVTPLIDVLLVLLIILMVIVPLAPRGMDAAVPQDGRTEQRQESRAVVLGVQANAAGEPTYTINTRAMSWAELGPALKNIMDSREDKAVFVRGDKELEYSRMAEVIDLAHRVGADRVGLITAGRRVTR